MATRRKTGPKTEPKRLRVIEYGFGVADICAAVKRRGLTMSLTLDGTRWTCVIGGCAGKPRTSVETAAVSAARAWNKSPRLPPAPTTAEVLMDRTFELQRKLEAVSGEIDALAEETKKVQRSQ